MQVFELKIDSAGDFKNKRFNLALSQGGMLLEDRQVQVEIGEFLFAEITGLRGTCHMIREGKSPFDALKECGLYLYNKFLGESIATKLLAAEKTLLKILVNKNDKKTMLIPWEILRDQENYLIKKGLVITRRPAEVYRPPLSPMSVADELRILIFASQPHDIKDLAVNREIDAVVKIFDFFNIGMNIQVDVLTYGCTRERLAEHLRNRPPYHVLHYIGAAAKNKLVMEDHDGASDPLYGDELAEILASVPRPPYLVVFTSPYPQSSSWEDRRKNYALRDISREREGKSRLDRFLGMSSDLISGGVTSAVVDFRLEIESQALFNFHREFYYQLIQNNLSIAASFHSAQRRALGEMPDQWFFPALHGGDAVNRPFIFEKTKKTKTSPAVRLTDLASPQLVSPADFVGRYGELSEIAKRLIYGNVTSLWIAGEEGVGKTSLAARTFDIWKKEYDGVFCYTFFPGCTLEEFWLDFRLFAIRNRLVTSLSRSELEGRSPSRRGEIIKNRILALLSSGRYLLILDTVQNLLEGKDSDIIFKDKNFETLFQSLFSTKKPVAKTLVCSPLFPEYFTGEPWEVSTLSLAGIKYNDMSAFTAKAPETAGFIRKLSTGERDKFYRLFQGITGLLELFEHCGEKQIWYEALESKLGFQEKVDDRGLQSVSLLLEKLSPDMKKLLSLLVRIKGDIFLPLLMKAFDAEEEEQIDGFGEAGQAGLIYVRKSPEPFMPDRVEVASIVYAYYLKNSMDREIFEQEHQFYLKRYGRAAIDMGRKWVEKEDSEQGFRLMLSAGESLFHGGDFSGASALLREIWQPLLDMCLFQTTRRMLEALIETVTDKREKIALIRNLGKILASQEEREEKENLYRKSLEINRFLGDLQEVACDLYELGVIQIDRGFYEKALEYTEESLELCIKLGTEEKKAAVMGKIAGIYQAKKDYAAAIDLYSKALDINRSHDDHSGASVFLQSLSDIYYKLGDYDKSMECEIRKVEADKASDNPYKMTQSLLRMVEIQVQTGNYEEGLTLLNKCMVLQKHLDDQIGTASALLKISDINHRQGHMKQALLYCQQSLQINRQLDHNPGLAANYQQLSLVYHSRKEPEQAIKYAMKSLDLFSKLHQKSDVVTIALHLGEIYQETSDYGQALFFYRQALEIRHDQENMEQIAHIQNLTANIYYLKGDADSAIDHDKQSLAIYKHLDRLPKVAEVLHQMAMIHQEQSNFTAAIELFEESLAINKELGNLIGIALTLGQMGRILEQEEKLCKAVGKYATSLAVFRQLKSGYEELATEDLVRIKKQLPEVEYKWCVTAGLEEHAAYLEDVEVQGRDF